MKITDIISEKRYSELLDRLATLHKEHEVMAELFKRTGDDDYHDHMRAARGLYNREVEKVADVLGVLAGYIHEDVVAHASR